MVTLRDSIKDWKQFEAVVYDAVKYAFGQLTPEQRVELTAPHAPMTPQERQQLINE